MNELVMQVDGAARGNPGPAGIGAVILRGDGKTLGQLSHFIGRATNNVAEYTALIRALELAQEYGAQDLVIQLDSQLVARQLQGRYKVKNKALMPLWKQVQKLLSPYCSVRVEQITRSENRRADRLANEAIDAALFGK
ncbi:MAG: ribonuclease HI family protein, partial [Anaerolineae bacterium]